MNILTLSLNLLVSFSPFIFLDFYGVTAADVLSSLSMQFSEAFDARERLAAVVMLSLMLFAANVALQITKECRERRANEQAHQSDLV